MKNSSGIFAGQQTVVVREIALVVQRRLFPRKMGFSQVFHCSSSRFHCGSFFRATIAPSAACEYAVAEARTRDWLRAHQHCLSEVPDLTGEAMLRTSLSFCESRFPCPRNRGIARYLDFVLKFHWVEAIVLIIKASNCGVVSGDQQERVEFTYPKELRPNNF